MNPNIYVNKMSSLEISNLTGKRHNNVLSDIKKTLLALGLNPEDFRKNIKMPSGQTSKTFELDKKLTLLLMSGYSIKIRQLIISRWDELEKQLKMPERKEIIEMSFDELMEASGILLDAGEDKIHGEMCAEWDWGVYERELLHLIDNGPYTLNEDRPWVKYAGEGSRETFKRLLNHGDLDWYLENYTTQEHANYLYKSLNKIDKSK